MPDNAMKGAMPIATTGAVTGAMESGGAGGRIAELARRGVVAVSGPDAEGFLNNIVSSDVPPQNGSASYGGLLSPQGKILFDFIAFRDGDRLLFDLPATAVPAFVRRLALYRLRAKVEIGPLADHAVFAGWDGALLPAGIAAFDPRLAAVGWRAIAPTGSIAANATAAEYDAHRIALGIPEGGPQDDLPRGLDFTFGEAFPHDVDMDQLAGVDFKKGCYIGQEVVSRMEHRGTARRRVVLATGSDALPAAGTPVLAGDRPIGTLGTSSDGKGLALVRLDRAREAMAAGTPITTGGAPITLTLPPWARFGWPAEATAPAEGG
jgi:folate-binding protein YgfZ